MTTWYVHRSGGAIASAHQERMAGYNDEPLDDQASAELQAFLAPPPAPIAGDVAAADAQNNPTIRALVKLLAANSVAIFGQARTVPQVVAILRGLA